LIFHPRRYRLEEREDFRIWIAMISAVWAPMTNPMKKSVISAPSAGHPMVAAETLEVELS
jgi:hypothetical protein